MKRIIQTCLLLTGLLTGLFFLPSASAQVKAQGKEQKITLDRISDLQESSLLGSWEYNLETGNCILNEGLRKHFGLSEDEKIIKQIQTKSVSQCLNIYQNI